MTDHKIYQQFVINAHIHFIGKVMDRHLNVPHRQQRRRPGATSISTKRITSAVLNQTITRTNDGENHNILI